MRPADITSLPKGFIVVTYSRDQNPLDLRLRPGEWERLRTQGYVGGIMVPEGTSLASLSDADLAAYGLKRIAGN